MGLREQVRVFNGRFKSDQSIPSPYWIVFIYIKNYELLNLRFQVRIDIMAYEKKI